MLSIIELNEVSKKIIGFYPSDKSLDSICNSTMDKVLVDCDLDSLIIFKNNENKNVSFEPIHDMNQMAHRDLYPVIAIDNNHTILMQAFANKNALELSLNTNYGH